MTALKVDKQSTSENLLYGRLAEENSRAAFRRVDKKKANFNFGFLTKIVTLDSRLLSVYVSDIMLFQPIW